jgi:hypothetical protein
MFRSNYCDTRQGCCYSWQLSLAGRPASVTMPRATEQCRQEGDDRAGTCESGAEDWHKSMDGIKGGGRGVIGS